MCICKLAYATRPLSRCYLRSYLVKKTAGAHKEPSKKCKSNLKEQATSNAELNTSITLKNLSHIHDLLTAELRDYADLIKFLNMSKT